MRIGTWNLAGRWDPRHRRLLDSADCDVWLLTEVREGVALDGYASETTKALMRKSVAWASVLSRSSMEPLPDPHGASAAARVDGVVFCSSILPWRASGSGSPWIGDTHLARTGAAVDALMAALPEGPVVWGGDWNHALVGRERAGSVGARQRILSALEDRRLSVPTRDLLHRIAGLHSIDHIALPAGVPATASRVSAVVDGVALSDHDVYVVECAEGDLGYRCLGGTAAAPT